MLNFEIFVWFEFNLILSQRGLLGFFEKFEKILKGRELMKFVIEFQQFEVESVIRVKINELLHIGIHRENNVNFF